MRILTCYCDFCKKEVKEESLSHVRDYPILYNYTNRIDYREWCRDCSEKFHTFFIDKKVLLIEQAFNLISCEAEFKEQLKGVIE